MGVRGPLVILLLLSVVPQADASPASVRDQVSAELASAGIDLSAGGYELDVLRQTKTEWAVLLSHALPQCSERTDLGELPESEDAAVKRVAIVVSRMHARISASEECRAARKWTPARQKALATSLEKSPTKGMVEHLTFGLLDTALGTSLLIAAGTEPTSSRDDETALVGVASIWLVGGVTSLALRDSDYAPTVASVSFLAGLGTGSLALAYSGEWKDKDGEVTLSDRRHDGFLITGIAMYATALGLIIDRARHRPSSPQKLWKHHQSMQDKARRFPATPLELNDIERDLRRADAPTSSWLLAAPLFLGTAALVTSGVAEDDHSEATLDYIMAGTLALAGLGVGILSDNDPARDYRNRLKPSVELVLTPTSMGIAGRF